MEIIMDALAIFCYGIYADCCRRSFERSLTKHFLAGDGISGPSLTAKSNKNYNIHNKLRKMELDFHNKIYAK